MAREKAGYSMADASQKFKKIAAWEEGIGAPTYPQLEKLAEAFKIPVSVFFFPEPPELPQINKTFRTLPDEEISKIPRRVRQLLHKAKAFQINLYELCQGKNSAPRLITKEFEFSPNANPVEMGAEVRNYLGVTLEEQKDWRDVETALKEWRTILQSVGVFVFKDAFRENNFSGFCLYDAEFPIIYINNSAAKTRQIFTLFHELAHLMFHSSGVDTLQDEYIPRLPLDNQKIEIICNKFAAEFLLPQTVFEQECDRLNADEKISEETAESLASHYHVSRESIFRRFRDHNLIKQATYDEAVQKWTKQWTNQRASQKKSGSGGNPYLTKIAYLGRDYIDLALSQYHQNKIDQNQLAEYLDTKPKYTNTLEEYYIGRGI